MLLLIAKMACEIFIARKGNKMSFHMRVNNEDEYISLNSYVLNGERNMHYKIKHHDVNGKKEDLHSGPYVRSISYTLDKEGYYIFEILNKSKGNRFVELSTSYNKRNRNVFYDKEVHEMFDNVFNGLADNHADALKIYDLKKSVIDLALRWKYRIGFLLFLSPLYILTAYLKSRYLRNLFALKKNGI